MRAERDARSAAIGLSLLGLAAAFFLLEAWTPRAPLDDAFISFRYARNLLAGQGLVFNPGERVEAITNLLWTLLLAAGLLTGFVAPAVAHVLGLAAGVGALVATWALARSLLPRSHAALAGFAPWVLLATPAFTYWSTAGMETPLFVALVTTALACQAAGHMGRATGALVLATLTRPDGALAAACVLGVHVLRQRASGLRVLREPALYALAIALLTGWRLLYFGSPVPNSFYAKVGGIPLERGVQYLAEFLRSGGAWLALLALPAALDARAWPAAALVLLTAAYTVAVGGDVFPFSRFLLPVLPALAALALCTVVLASRRSPWLGAAASLALALAATQAIYGGPRQALRSPWPTPRRAALEQAWRENCEFHNIATRMGWRVRAQAERGEPVDLVAAGSIGAIGWYSELPILDAFGLADPVIARHRGTRPAGAIALPGHQRSHADYLLSRRPAYIMLKPPGAVQFAAELDLRRHPDFEQQFEQVRRWGLYRRIDLEPKLPLLPTNPPQLDCGDPAAGSPRKR